MDRHRRTRRLSRFKYKDTTPNFDGTAGGLRSDHIYAIFPDREGVIWFGTDRGVCRFDPQAPRVESIGDNIESNCARALSNKQRTNAGRHQPRPVCLRRRNFAVDHRAGSGNEHHLRCSEDKLQRLLVAAASGFYVGPRQPTPLRDQVFTDSSWFRNGRWRARAITSTRGATYYAIYGRGIERMDGPRGSVSWPSTSQTRVK